MTAKERLEGLKKVYEDVTLTLHLLDKQAGLDVDGPLYTSVFACIDNAIAATAELIGLPVNVLDWFVYDDNWGHEKRSCKVAGSNIEVEIDSIDTFLAFEGVVDA